MSHLVATSQVDARFRDWFPYPSFNAVQSAAFSTLMYSDENAVVSAPTGAGKTVIFELAMVRAFRTSMHIQAVYIGPTRSLCGERAQDWKNKLERLNLKVFELTGDTDAQYVTADVNLIVATPEKFDSVTRNATCLQDIRLFMLDEVHMLNEVRGATLEALISRMKLKTPGARFIAVSATIPNSFDICRWLPMPNGMPAKNLHFGPEMRPVPLEQHVICTPINGKSAFIYENNLNFQLPALIDRYSGGKPVIVFCSTRKSALMTAEFLAKQKSVGSSSKGVCNDTKLTKLLSLGIGMHHAGLTSSDRQQVEQAFLRGVIRILCCTITLAVGVNLPAHLVIIKSTLMYNGRAYCEYSELDILQMIGRAGRPQFDTRGIALIMTDPGNRERYANLCAGMRPIESCLGDNLIEHVMAEVAAGAIKNIPDAMEWIRRSYLYIRMQSNPGRYMSVDDRLQAIFASLEGAGLVRNVSDFYLPTKVGQAMARAYVRFGTMQVIHEMPANPSHKDILLTISRSGEFDELRFQSGDKSILNELIKDPRIRYREGGQLKHVWQRTFYLMQAQLGDIAIPKFGQQQAQEVQWIFTRSHRIIRCIIECLSDRGDGFGLLNALEMQSMLVAQMWFDSSLCLTQIARLGKAYCRTLSEAGIKGIADLHAIDARRIEVILGRNPPFGNQIKEAAGVLPQGYIRVDQIGSDRFNVVYGYATFANNNNNNNKNVRATFLVLAHKNDNIADIVERRNHTGTRLNESIVNIITIPGWPHDYCKLAFHLVSEEFSTANSDDVSVSFRFVVGVDVTYCFSADNLVEQEEIAAYDAAMRTAPVTSVVFPQVPSTPVSISSSSTCRHQCRNKDNNNATLVNKRPPSPPTTVLQPPKVLPQRNDSTIKDGWRSWLSQYRLKPANISSSNIEYFETMDRVPFRIEIIQPRQRLMDNFASAINSTTTAAKSSSQ